MMYEETPERNEPCWCGSGKKYKKCHHAFDEKLESLYLAGHEVPDHFLIKTPEDIEGIKRSAAVNIGCLDTVAANIKAGVTTEQINQWVHNYTIEHGAIPAPLDYEGFPKSVCVSINNVVCHGIPSDDVVLKDGDIVNVDCSTILDGYFSDSSRMFMIGEVSEERKRLVEVTHESIEEALKAVKPWEPIGNLAVVVSNYAKEHGYSVVRELGGHGCGNEFHEEPFVSFVPLQDPGMIMAPGMVFTIEPMLNGGKPDVVFDQEDGWTVTTIDGADSAQWEVELVVTEDGYELLSY